MSTRAFALLAFASFAVQLGYGVILPLLPALLERIGGDTSATARALHTSGLTTAYMLAVFAAALPGGRLADRCGARAVLLAGLAAHSAAVMALSAATDLPAAYLLRALAGAFAGIVLAAVAATIAEEGDAARRARMFAGSGAAALVGLVAGPALSGIVSGMMKGMPEAGDRLSMSLALPFAAAAAIGIATFAAIAASRERHANVRAAAPAAAVRASAFADTALRAVLAANFLLFFALGSLEVIMPLFGKERLALDALALGLLFAECSVVMIVIQGGLFFSPVLSRVSPRRVAASAFVLIALGFALLAPAGTLLAASLAVALVAAAGGYLLPALNFAASLGAPGGRGEALGALTAAGSLGQAVGSAAGGALYGALGSTALWTLAAAMTAGIACARALRASAGPTSRNAVVGSSIGHGP